MRQLAYSTDHTLRDAFARRRVFSAPVNRPHECPSRVSSSGVCKRDMASRSRGMHGALRWSSIRENPRGKAWAVCVGCRGFALRWRRIGCGAGGSAAVVAAACSRRVAAGALGRGESDCDLRPSSHRSTNETKGPDCSAARAFMFSASNARVCQLSPGHRPWHAVSLRGASLDADGSCADPCLVLLSSSLHEVSNPLPSPFDVASRAGRTQRAIISRRSSASG